MSAKRSSLVPTEQGVGDQPRATTGGDRGRRTSQAPKGKSRQSQTPPSRGLRIRKV